MQKTISCGRLLAAFAVGAALSSTVAFSQTAMFSVKVLANIPGETQASASGINNAGNVVGTVFGSSKCPTACAVVWSNGAPTLLGSVAGSTATFPSSINNAGQIAGTAALVGEGLSTAVIWNNGTSTILPAGPYNNESQAAFINDSGQVVGYSASSAIVWNGLSPTVLGLAGSTLGKASGINNSGLIVGDTQDNIPVVWHGTIPHNLPTISAPGGGKALAVNDSGLVVGISSTNEGQYSSHAAAWANGKVTDLGALNTTSSALAVNNRGIIVGQSDSVGVSNVHAVIWSRIGAPIQDLNKLISATAASEVILTGAYSINDNCTIVVGGFSRKTKLDQALLLTLNDQSKCVNGLD